jgi:hypothetical protein
MRSITRQKCVGCTGLFAALVTSDCSYRDRGGLILAVHFPPRRISGFQITYKTAQTFYVLTGTNLRFYDLYRGV